MEEEISGLISNLPDLAFREVEGVYLFKHGIGKVRAEFSSFAENISNFKGKPVAIRFYDGLAEHSELKLDTDKSLMIGLHTDEPSREAFEAYAKKDPVRAENAQTEYYFTKSGDYKKVSYIPRNILMDPDRKPLRGFDQDPEVILIHYLSEMTPGDFEIAGRALAMIKQRLTTRLSELSSQ